MGVRDADSHKLSYHPFELSRWLKYENIPPIHVELGITNRCNHKCEFCTLNWINHGKIDINTNIMLKTLKDFSEMGVKSIYFAGEGEPTLHPDFLLFVNEAHNLGLKIALSTNGSRFDSKMGLSVIDKLSWIRFSLDSINPSTYSKMHGVYKGELFKVLKNITDSVKNRKRDIDIGVQAIFTPDNANEMYEIGKLMKEIGVDNFQIKPAHSHPKSSYKPELYDFSSNELVEKIKSLETKDFITVIRLKSLDRLRVERNYRECHGFHFYGLIDANGSVVPCNVFYNQPEFIYGNINKESFKDIWNSERRQEIIQNIKKSEHKYCSSYRCRLDVMNRYLERVKFPEKNDEFI